MPPNRSRTLEWRRCLSQIHDRGGAIEIALNSNDDTNAHGDLLWRVRVIDFDDNCLTVEQPYALGRSIELNQGIELVAFITIGQNRWTFDTTCLGPGQPLRNSYGETLTLRLSMPKDGSVKRCRRRRHDRLNTSDLRLPRVEMWPLLEPGSTVLAERAVALQFSSGEKSSANRPSQEVMPEVGPRFTSTLMNIGGGGIGALIEPEDAQTLSRHNLFWIRIVLPGLVTPIYAAGRVVHTHIESTNQTYAGIAFDFTFNPSHQQTVVDQICRYVQMQQNKQLRKSA